MSRLISRLWADDCGAVLTTEYLALGSIVGLGAASGLQAMKDAVVEECHEYGRAVHHVARVRHVAPAESRAPHSDAGFASGDRGHTHMTP